MALFLHSEVLQHLQMSDIMQTVNAMCKCVTNRVKLLCVHCISHMDEEELHLCLSYSAS